MKLFIISLSCLIFLTNGNCDTLRKNNSKRRMLIENAIKAITAKDFENLYKIVDTAYFNSIYGSEIFVDRINSISMKIQQCNKPVLLDSLFQVESESTGTTDYIVSLCKNFKVDDMRFNYDLVFTFANYEDNSLVKMISIKNDFFEKKDKFNPKPPIHPTSQ